MEKILANWGRKRSCNSNANKPYFLSTTSKEYITSSLAHVVGWNHQHRYRRLSLRHRTPTAPALWPATQQGSPAATPIPSLSSTPFLFMSSSKTSARRCPPMSRMASEQLGPCPLGPDPATPAPDLTCLRPLAAFPPPAGAARIRIHGLHPMLLARQAATWMERPLVGLQHIHGGVDKARRRPMRCHAPCIFLT
jgi:hypothetical protein